MEAFCPAAALNLPPAAPSPGIFPTSGRLHRLALLISAGRHVGCMHPAGSHRGVKDLSSRARTLRARTRRAAVPEVTGRATVGLALRGRERAIVRELDWGKSVGTLHVQRCALANFA